LEQNKIVLLISGRISNQFNFKMKLLTTRASPRATIHKMSTRYFSKNGRRSNNSTHMNTWSIISQICFVN